MQIVAIMTPLRFLPWPVFLPYSGLCAIQIT